MGTGGRFRVCALVPVLVAGLLLCGARIAVQLTGAGVEGHAALASFLGVDCDPEPFLGCDAASQRAA